MLIDTNSDFGKRVERRLQEEWIGWLTTVDSDGVPQPRPIWFLWDGSTFLIYSRPRTAKLAHLGRNSNVSLSLDSDGRGGNIVVFTGEAAVLADPPPAEQVTAYLEKYREGLKRIGMKPKEFADAYSVAIQVRPNKLRGH